MMKRFRLLDLRHYTRQKPSTRHGEKTAARIKKEQQPTAYGRISTEIVGEMLRTAFGKPTFRGGSPQPRAYLPSNRFDSINGWGLTHIPFASFNDLSSDPNFDKKRLKRENGWSSQKGKSIELSAITIPWSKEYVFGRALKCFAELGQWLNTNANDGDSLLLTSHGALVEMRYLMLQLLLKGTPINEQTVDMIDVKNLYDGMFECLEGYELWLMVDDNGVITGVEINDHCIDEFRLPAGVLALKETLK